MARELSPLMSALRSVKPISILHMVTGLEAHGAQRVLSRLVEFGSRLGWRSQVVSLTTRGPMADRIEAAGVPVTALGIQHYLFTPWQFARLRKVVARSKPDVIQGWMYHANIATLAARWFAERETPVVWAIRHSLYSLEREKAAMQWIIRISARLSNHADILVYNSLSSREQHRTIGFKGENCPVIPNGIDLDRFTVRSEAGAALRRRLGVSPRSLLVGHAARFHPVKDHETFLGAAKLVASRAVRAHFVLMGDGVDEHGPELYRRVTGERPSNRFHFLGPVANIDRVLPGLDVFCLSSRAEAFPNVVAEAMACGVPCVATDVGDVARLVGDTGRVVRRRDSEGLATALLDLVRLPAEARARMGREGRARIAAEYTLAGVASRYDLLYRNLAKGTWTGSVTPDQANWTG